MVSARYPVRAVAFVAFYIVCASCVGGHGAGRPALRGSTDKSGTDNSGVGFPQKRNREKFLSKTLFLGQLPFSTTKEQLQLFFARRGIGDVNIRMLTDRKTNVFRGMAFVDFQNEKDAEIALKMDHGLLGGRRIRIERTASGGGNKPKRKARIVRAKQERDTEKRKEVIAMIDRIFTRQVTNLRRPCAWSRTDIASGASRRLEHLSSPMLAHSWMTQTFTLAAAYQ